MHRFLPGQTKTAGGMAALVSRLTTRGDFARIRRPGEHFVVYAYPPKGKPYLSILRDFDWPKGAVEHAVDLALPRGVAIRGKVTEQGSGKAIAGAWVMFNAHSGPDVNPGSRSIQTETADDGSYQLTALPGPGHLAVQGPSKDYVLQAISEFLFFEGRPGGKRFYSNAFILCDPKPGSA